MLDDDDGVALVAQLLERVDESLIVALMQSDAGLVEDVEHVDELRANLCSQTDALALTARECCRLAVEREIVKAHVEKKRHAGAQLLDDLVGNALLAFFEMILDLIEPVAQQVDVEIADLTDVLVPNAIGEGFLLQSFAVADGALLVSQKLRRPFLSGGTVIALDERAQVFHDAVKGHEVVRRGVHLVFVDADLFERAVHQFVDSVLGYVLKRCLEVAVVFAEYRLYLPEDHLVLVFA